VVLKAATNTPAANSSLWQIGNAAAYGSILGNSYPEMNGSIADDFASTTMKYEGVASQSLTQYHLYEVASQPNNFATWINGGLLYQNVTNVVGFAAAGTIYTGGMSLGCFHYFIPNTGNNDVAGSYNGFFNGDIAEVLIFNRGLTWDERIVVGNYLTSKYNLSQSAVNSSPPGMPTNLMATGVAPYRINLSWARTSTNETAFIIERKLGVGGTYQEIGSVSPATNFVDATASPTNQNFYRVKAENYFGQSSYSPEISPPSISLSSVLPTVFVNSTNEVVALAADADGSISNVMFFSRYWPTGIATLSPYTNNWMPIMEGTTFLTALATDNQGNSQYSAPVTVTVYLDSNGDGVPDYLQVSQGNDPLNPWTPPAFNTNDLTAPIITLLIPTNAVVVP